MPARVATAAETVDCERATIEAGTSAQELMERAGRAAANEILRRYKLLLPAGVTVFTGPGNNGGDGWVVARCLAEAEVPVTVIEAAPARTKEAQVAEHSAGEEQVGHLEGDDEPRALTDAGIIVDALLGTGSTGAPRDPIASAIEIINSSGRDGAAVVALDIPSGVDATTGAHELCVEADLTLTFGLVKRGQLVARDVCGEINALDIGLVNEHQDALPILVDRDWVSQRIPRISANAHKGTRRRLGIVGGGVGMAGAAILSGKGALRSGIGLVRLCVAEENIAAIHAGLPEALVQPWPKSAEEIRTLLDSSDAIAIGPGLGKSQMTRDLVERIMLAWNGPVVVDADALNDFAGDASSLAKLLGNRASVITPHPAELGRLIGKSTDEVVQTRFDVGQELARESGAAVLLKGVPTVIFSADGTRFVSASGTAALATGGSGDVLTGIVGTLLAQMSRSSAEIAAVAAFIHGRAAELCGPVRGTTLDDILEALPDAWNEVPQEFEEPVLACVPAVP